MNKEYKILTCLRHPSHGGKYEFAKGMVRKAEKVLSAFLLIYEDAF